MGERYDVSVGCIETPYHHASATTPLLFAEFNHGQSCWTATSHFRKFAKLCRSSVFLGKYREERPKKPKFSKSVATCDNAQKMDVPSVPKLLHYSTLFLDN